MKKFQIKLVKCESSEDDKAFETIKLDGQTSQAAKRSDVIAWAKKEYPDYKVESLRLFKQQQGKAKMKMQEIESSVFKAMGYDEERQALHIQFNSGATFEYGQVLPEHWEGMKAADSAGAYFSRYIRPTHDAKPIAPAGRKHVKLIERVGDVSRVLEFDTVAELLEYERGNEEVKADSATVSLSHGQQEVIDKIAESTEGAFQFDELTVMKEKLTE